MSTCQTLQEKHDQLVAKLNRNVQKKHTLELEINQEFGELKKIEISLEINFEKELEASQAKAKFCRAEHH